VSAFYALCVKGLQQHSATEAADISARTVLHSCGRYEQPSNSNTRVH